MPEKLNAISKRLMPPARRARSVDVALLAARLAFGGMMLVHGWDKLTHFEAKSERFMDFMGLGPSVSLALAIFAEFFCALLLLPGLLTRFASFMLMFTMFVAAFVRHGDDPFAKKEKALLFLAGYLVIFLAGPGRLAVDHLLFGKGDDAGKP